MSAALLIIDMQVGLFHGPEKPHDGERVLANIQYLIHQARQQHVPIYAVRHTGPAGSPIAAGSAFCCRNSNSRLTPTTCLINPGPTLSTARIWRRSSMLHRSTTCTSSA